MGVFYSTRAGESGNKQQFLNMTKHISPQIIGGLVVSAVIWLCRSVDSESTHLNNTQSNKFNQFNEVH